MSLGICSLLATAIAAVYAVRTGDSCERAVQAWTLTEEGSKLAESYDNAAHGEFEKAYIACSAQNLCEVAGVLLISLIFLAVLRQATATLQDKMRLVGSCERSSISSDGSSSGATGAELKDVKMKSVGEFSSPEEMVRHMMQRAMKASIHQRKRLLITNALVCLTLIPRCVFVIFVAISNFNNKMDP
jgi:hypothetical protein